MRHKRALFTVSCVVVVCNKAPVAQAKCIITHSWTDAGLDVNVLHLVIKSHHAVFLPHAPTHTIHRRHLLN